jgi:hypothetical protein
MRLVVNLFQDPGDVLAIIGMVAVCTLFCSAINVLQFAPLLTENFNNFINVRTVHFSNGPLDLKIGNLINFHSGEDFKGRRVLYVSTSFKCAGFDPRLTGGTELLSHHSFLKRLVDHLTNDFLTNTAAEALLHNLHGHFARPKSWQTHITCRLTEALLDRAVNPIRGDANGKAPL